MPKKISFGVSITCLWIFFEQSLTLKAPLFYGQTLGHVIHMNRHFQARRQVLIDMISHFLSQIAATDPLRPQEPLRTKNENGLGLSIYK